MKTHGYCLTINNPEQKDWLPFLQLEKEDPHPFGWTTPQVPGVIKRLDFRNQHPVLHKHGIQYIIYGKETGKNGTNHHQMFVVFRRTTSFNKVKKIWPRAHIEHTRGSFNEARDYCKKGGKYYDYGYEINVCRDNIDRDNHLMSAASEESDLRADIALISQTMRNIDDSLKVQTQVLERLILSLEERKERG